MGSFNCSCAPDSQKFPFTSLPYEIQLEIAKFAITSCRPILIGRSVTRRTVDSTEELHSKRTGALLQTCRDFYYSRELTRYHYTQNFFEFGYYYGLSALFDRPSKDLINHVVVDALRILVRPVGAPNPIMEKLSLLPSLRTFTIRLRGASLGRMQSEEFQRILLSMLRGLETLETIRLVVELPLGEDEENEGWLRRYKAFVERFLDDEIVWPGGVPDGRQPVKFEVSASVVGGTLFVC